MHLKWIIILWWAFPSLSSAEDIKLAWDPSSSSNVSGYKVYIGKSSGVYWTPITIPDQVTYTVSGLGPGIYYFAVTAFNEVGESGYSNEVFTTIGQAPFVITSASASLRWFGAVLQCTTSQKANAILRFSKIEPGAGTSTIIATTGFSKTTHRAVLYLPSGTAYYRYEWEATDAGGNIQKQSGTFQTR